MKYKVLKQFTLFGVKYKKGDIISTDKDSHDVFFQEDADALISNMNEGYLEEIYKEPKIKLLPYREYSPEEYYGFRANSDFKLINTKTEKEQIFKKKDNVLFDKNTTNEEFQVFTKIASIGFDWFGNGKYGDIIALRPDFPPYIEERRFKTKGVDHYKIEELCSETT